MKKLKIEIPSGANELFILYRVMDMRHFYVAVQ